MNSEHRLSFEVCLNSEEITEKMFFSCSTNLLHTCCTPCNAEVSWSTSHTHLIVNSAITVKLMIQNWKKLSSTQRSDSAARQSSQFHPTQVHFTHTLFWDLCCCCKPGEWQNCFSCHQGKNKAAHLENWPFSLLSLHFPGLCPPT